jgi:hypothetical protein
MGTKTYRVKKTLAEEAEKRVIKYIAEQKELITEAEMICIAIEKGLKEITNEEISEMIIRHRKD